MIDFIGGLIVGPTVKSSAFLSSFGTKIWHISFFHSNSFNNVPVDHTASDEWGR